MLLWQFKTYALDKHLAYMVVAMVVIALGEERPTRNPQYLSVFAMPRRVLGEWIQRDAGVGPKVAAAIISAALNASCYDPTLRLVQGRVEVHVPDPTWPGGLRAVE